MTTRNAEKHMPSSYDPMTEIALGLSMIFFTMMILISLPSQGQHIRKGQEKSPPRTQPSLQGTIGDELLSKKHKYLFFDGKYLFSTEGLKLEKADIDEIISKNTTIQIGLQEDMSLKGVSYLEEIFAGKKIFLSIIEKGEYLKNGLVQ